MCQNYRTISLISHASKVMLKIILNRLQHQAEEIIAEEQAGFRRGRSTTEQIFNLRVLCEKYSQHQQDLYHVFIDFEKAFDRVWQDALWATMKKYNMGQKIINTASATASRFRMEISAEKTKLMTNSHKQITTNIEVRGQELKTVNHFKYLGSIISEDGSKPEILARTVQTTAAMSKLKPVWRDKNTSLKTKIRLLCALILSVFLYACESWTLTAELQQRIQALEMRCYRTILGISYKDHITNETVRNIIRRKTGQYEDLLTAVRKRKLKWYGHVIRANNLSTTILQGSVPGGRRRGRQRKKWADNITEWTMKSFAETQALADD